MVRPVWPIWKRCGFQPGVDGRARGAHRGADDPGQLLEQHEVLGALEPAAARDDDLGLGELREARLRFLPPLDEARGRGRRPEALALHRRRAARLGLRGLEDVRAQGGHPRARLPADPGQELAGIHGTRRDELAVGQAERHAVGGDPRAEPRRQPRHQLPVAARHGAPDRPRRLAPGERRRSPAPTSRRGTGPAPRPPTARSARPPRRRAGRGPRAPRGR